MSPFLLLAIGALAGWLLVRYRPAIFLLQIPASAAEKVLASFATKDAVKAWTSVNDGVMGGVSKGGASRTEQGTLLFSGELSLANNAARG